MVEYLVRLLRRTDSRPARIGIWALLAIAILWWVASNAHTAFWLLGHLGFSEQEITAWLVRSASGALVPLAYTVVILTTLFLGAAYILPLVRPEVFQRLDNLEQSEKSLQNVRGVSQTFQANQTVTGYATVQLIPPPERMDEWRQLRESAVGLAASILVYLIGQQRKALLANPIEANAIENETVRESESRFGIEVRRVAEALTHYGRRGDGGLDKPYDRLAQLTKDRGPSNFAEIRDIATSINSILLSDGYAAFQNRASTPSS
jgi:hypothetical protein